MAETPLFQQKQYELAAHLRDPDNVPPPAGIEDRRLAIYRELFFNNLYSLLGSTFPVLRKLYGDDGWKRLTRAFMASYKAHTPYFLEVPREFVSFLENRYELTDDDLPFLAELAHYEWVELALSVSDEENPEDIDPDGDLLEGIPVKSVLAWPLAYQFPVHRINTEFQPREPGQAPTYLCVYRQDDDELGFMELNPVTMRLIELIGDNQHGASGETLVRALAAEIGWPDPDAFVAHGAAALAELRSAGIVPGTRRIPD